MGVASGPPAWDTDEFAECISGLLFTSGVSEHSMDYHEVTFFLQVGSCRSALGGHAQLLFLSELPPEDDGTGARTGLHCNTPVSALWCRSSRYMAMILPSLLVTLPRCGGSHRSGIAAATQMGAAIGWLQRNWSRSSDGRVPGQEVDSCSVRRRSGFAMAPLVVDVSNHTSDEEANTLPPRHVDDNRSAHAARASVVATILH